MSEPAEREADFESTVERAVRQLAEEVRRTVTDHPEPEELVDYQEGRLAETEAERVRRHLVACSECAKEVLELEAFDLDEPEDSELRPTAVETAEDWTKFQQRCTEEQKGTRVLEMAGRVTRSPHQGEPQGALSSVAPTARGIRPWWPLAASIVIAVTGVGFWIGGFAERKTIEPEISPNPYVFDLVPEGEGNRRDASTVRSVEVPAGMDPLLPRLNLGDQSPYETYRADIFDASGAKAWSQSGLRRQPAGQFIVLVRRASLPAGEYRLDLVGTTGDEQEILATYFFRLSYEPDP